MTLDGIASAGDVVSARAWYRPSTGALALGVTMGSSVADTEGMRVSWTVTPPAADGACPGTTGPGTVRTLVGFSNPTSPVVAVDGFAGAGDGLGWRVADRELTVTTRYAALEARDYRCVSGRVFTPGADGSEAVHDDFSLIMDATAADLPVPPGDPAPDAVVAANPVPVPVVRRGFRSPSGNIRCAMVRDRTTRVTCRTVSPSRSVALTAGRRPFRGTRMLSGSTTRRLGYGSVMTLGRITCTSFTFGVACRDRRSGRGFLIAREGVALRPFTRPVWAPARPAAPAPSRPSAPRPVAPAPSGNSYAGRTCAEIGHSYRVPPGSDREHDADGDGVACESY